jgi:restriction endonuclease S subunit
MTATLPSLAKLKPNPDWATLPLFDRSGWKRFRFGDVVENVNERVEPSTAAEEIYVGLDDLDSGSLHIRRWGKGSDVIGTKLRFRKGDIIFGRRRAYQRKLAVAELDGICSAHAMVARSKPKVVLPEFLPFLMMSDKFMNRAVDISVGSLSPTINWTTLKLEEFDLPPLDQQRRIAEILWAVDDVLEANKQLAEVARTFLSRRGDELLWGYNDASTRKTLSPRNGKLSTYGEITNRITYGFTNPMPTTEDGPWMVTAKDVVDGRIDYSTARHTDQEAYDKLLTAKSRPRIGDVLLTKDGTIGRVALVDQPNICISQSVALIEPKLEVVTPEFVAWTLRSARMQKRLIDDAGGSAIKHIYITKVATTAVVVPPLKEQRQVVGELENMSSAIADAERHSASSRSLLAALIDNLT